MKIKRKITFAMGICMAAGFMAGDVLCIQAADPGPSQNIWLDVAKKRLQPPDLRYRSHYVCLRGKRDVRCGQQSEDICR